MHQQVIGDVCCVCVSSKIGEDQSAEDAEDGPPELLVSDGFMFSITHHSLPI